MSLRKLFYMGILFVLVFILTGCGGGNEPASGDSALDVLNEDSVGLSGVNGDGLKISGLVDAASFWSVEELVAMEMIEVVSENSSGDETIYNGVPIIVLLGLAGVQDDATQILFKGEDGTQVEVLLEEINACIQCIVALGDSTGFNIVLPGFPSSPVILKVVELELK